VLTKRVLAAADGFTVEDVLCTSGRSSWSTSEPATKDSIVFVRRGCFRRRVDGVESFLDPVAIYFERVGQEEEIAHPSDGGDECTQIVLAAGAVEAVWGGDFRPPARPLFTSPQADLAHRQLVGSLRSGDVLELGERIVQLLEFVRDCGTRRRTRGRPATAAARRRAVDAAREAIAIQPTIGLFELARVVAISPHHLSRIFRAETGETITRYRNRARVRLVLERLAERERSLARLAGELGFADQAHLARVVRREVGSTPSALRSTLGI
jgi:AraC-like DNA-binding protein